MTLLKYAAAILFLGVLLSPAQALIQGDQEIEKKGDVYLQRYEEELDTVEGGTLTLKTTQGSVSVVSWEREKVGLVVEKKAIGLSEEEAQLAFENFHVRFVSRGKNARIEGTGSKKSYVDSLEVSFEVAVPEKFSVKVETSDGMIEIGDFKGGVRAVAQKGSITIGTVINGAVHVETKKGNIAIHGIQNGKESAHIETAGGAIIVGAASGNLHLDAKGGSITVQKAGGSIHAETDGHSISVGECIGYLHVETEGGGFNVEKALEGLHVETVGGGVMIAQAKGKVKVESGGGAVQILSVDGNVKVESRGGSIQIGSVDGEINVESEGGAIHIEKALGKVKAETDAGSISVGEAGGPVNIETRGGQIFLGAVRGGIKAETAGGNIHANLTVADKDVNTQSDLEAKGGNIILTLPSALAATIEAEIRITRKAVRNYRIYSDFPVVIQGDNGKKITGKGKLNGGGDKIRLSTINGNIHIKSNTPQKKEFF